MATALANTVRKVFDGLSNNGQIITFTLEPDFSCYECRVYFYGGLLGVYSLARNIFGPNGAKIRTVWEEGAPKIYSITVDEATGIVSMVGTTLDGVMFKIYEL